MYDDVICDSIIDNLENKTVNIVDTAIMLADKGYLINKKKYVQLEWASLLISAFENIHILNKEQQGNVERIYNKLFNI